MPLYEYRCENCGELFEVRQKFADEPLSTHEKCGGHVERLLSVPAFQFKGSGWYVTDYAKSGEKSGSNGDSGKAESGEKESGSAKKDSSPAPAAPTTKSESSSSETKSSSDTKSSS